MNVFNLTPYCFKRASFQQGSSSRRINRLSGQDQQRSQRSGLWGRSPTQFSKRLWPKLALGLSLIPATFAAVPAHAAERIYVSYGILERSISVDSLEVYARTGEVKKDLAAYAELATPEQLNEIRTVLLSRAEISPIAVSQFLYTEQGETLLRRIGTVVQTETRQSGLYAIRSALILASTDPQGLTPLNVLRRFPSYGVRVDVEQTLRLVQQVERLINQSNGAIATVERQSAIEAAEDPNQTFTDFQDLYLTGDYTWDKETITLNDESRGRTFDADIYLPKALTGSDPVSAAPVIVISHGLGSGRSTYAYLAAHLASYGFAVAVPEHPGSNSDQLQALIDGRANEVTDPDEFVNRPLDIKFLLDDLETLSHSDPRFRGKLNLQNVGVVGQSFGGYTALTLAGANINFPQLDQDCKNDSFNLSLLLQCRARGLRQPSADLHDSRVKAVIAINPIGSSVLGQEGYSKIDVPVMVISGNADTVAPALLEQIWPFTWLNTPNKYLVLMRGATHFSTLGEASRNDTVVDLPVEVVGPDRALARRYLNAMSVAFFQTYVAGKPSYRKYLGAAYARELSQNILPLRLVRFLTPTQLAESLDVDPADLTSVEFSPPPNSPQESEQQQGQRNDSSSGNQI
ncbi:MAG TPA: alpha/beta hydrolase [Crinalium sp.]